MAWRGTRFWSRVMLWRRITQTADCSPRGPPRLVARIPYITGVAAVLVVVAVGGVVVRITPRLSGRFSRQPWFLALGGTQTHVSMGDGCGKILAAGVVVCALWVCVPALDKREGIVGWWWYYCPLNARVIASA